MNEINEKLIEVQQEWEKECYNPLKKEYENDESRGKLSCAFSFGVSDHYFNSQNRVMVVGQEAKGHTFDGDAWGLKNWQKWAIAYLNFQVYGEESPNVRFSENNSPFWQFMRKLNQRGYDLCWNNLDKVRRYIRPDGKEWVEDYLPYDKKENCERKALNEKIFDGKSLLQKEIEFAEPKFVIFAVGPKNPYYHTLCNAFFDGKDAYERLLDAYPKFTENGGIVEISEKLGLKMPAYYIYHPNYFQLQGKLDTIVEKLAQEMRFAARSIDATASF